MPLVLAVEKTPCRTLEDATLVAGVAVKFERSAYVCIFVSLGVLRCEDGGCTDDVLCYLHEID